MTSPSPTADIPRAPHRPRWSRAKRWAIALIGLPILLYSILVAYFYLDTPDPSTDYLAQLNAPAVAVPEADRAWPIYRDAFIAADFVNLQLDPIFSNPDDWPQELIRPDHPAWPDAVTFLHQHQPLLDALRLAATKPGLGLTVGSDDHFTGDDHLALFGRKGPSDWASPQIQSFPILERLHRDHLPFVVLPHLSRLREAGRLLVTDMRLAVQQNDPDRWMANFHTLVGLARHTRETRIVISDMVARSILMMAHNEAGHTLHHHAEFLRDAELDALRSIVVTLMPRYETAVFDSERLMLLDTAQRAYGRSGRVTYHGLRFLNTWLTGPHMNGSYQPPPLTERAYRLAVMPITAMRMASRAEIEREFDHIFQAGLADAKRPLWELLHQPSESKQRIDALDARDPTGDRYHRVLWLPSFATHARTARETIAYLESLTVALALESYRRAQGNYPDTLAQLVPAYLADPPLDHSTGQALRYTLIDGKPLLYGLGLNQTDNGGTFTDEGRDDWPEIPDTGDWILYPPPTPTRPTRTTQR